MISGLILNAGTYAIKLTGQNDSVLLGSGLSIVGSTTADFQYGIPAVTDSLAHLRAADAGNGTWTDPVSGEKLRAQ